MISPYKGKFRVSQEYKGSAHQGLDLVGVDSKNIYSIFNGKIEVASHADPNGFGTYVRMKITSGAYKGYVCYYGHMSKVEVKVGDKVKIGALLGLEGSTGRSTGSHCHLEVRRTTASSSYQDINRITGIGNKQGMYEVKHAETAFYKKATYKGGSLVDALASINVQSGFNYRKKIAKANGIKVYLGTAVQNIKLLALLKKGELIKP